MKNILFIVPFLFSFLIINAQEVECPDGYIADCNGNCAPETWGADDGYCDDKTVIRKENKQCER